DFVFLHVIGIQPVQIRQRVRHGRFVRFNAIHRHIDRSVASAVNMNARTGGSGRPLDYTLFQCDQRKRIASVERQIGNRLALDDVADNRISRLQNFSLRSNAHRLGDSADLQRHVDHERRVDLQSISGLRRGLETWKRNRNRVDPHRQRRKSIEAGLGGFPSLPVGIYTITVTLPGFKTATKTGNTLEVNTPLVINMSLEVGGITETVSIAAETEVLQTTNAVIGNVVERKAIADLPLNGRNPLALIALEQGVVQRSAGAAGSGIHVNGARDRSVNVTVDGIEANESSVPNPLSNLYRLNPDNVQEYKVTTNNATPEEDRKSGG